MQNFFESILKYIETISNSFKILSIALKFKKLQKTLKVFQALSMYFQYDRHWNDLKDFELFQNLSMSIKYERYLKLFETSLKIFESKWKTLESLSKSFKIFFVLKDTENIRKVFESLQKSFKVFQDWKHLKLFERHLKVF